MFSIICEEKIEPLISNSIKVGALGGKLTGAGLGGSLVILAPGKEKEVSKAIELSDGIPYVVRVDQGVVLTPFCQRRRCRSAFYFEAEINIDITH